MAPALATLKSTARVGIEAPVGVDVPPLSSLAKLPGHSWGDAVFRPTHKKAQALKNEFNGVTKEFRSTYVQRAVKQRDAAATMQPVSEQARRLVDVLTSGVNNTQLTFDDAGPFVDLENKVLRFYGFWKEACVETPKEATRVRKVTITVYPHDETVMIVEPRVANSGIQGGTLVRRHRIPADVAVCRRRSKKTNPGARIPSEDANPDEPHLNPDDFNVGTEVDVYGKCIRIVDCDEFTREFLNELGVDVPPPEPYPEEEYVANDGQRGTKSQRSFADYDMVKTFEHASRGRSTTHYPEEVKRVQRFLSGPEQVCRFYAFWDDRENAHGDLRRFEIRYHTVDETVEVVERQPPNSGRDPSRALCGRRRLPKAGKSMGSDLTFSSRTNGYQYDVVVGQAQDEQYYTLGDFCVGTEVNVFGRKLEIYATDAWTKDYIREHLGRDVGTDEDISHKTRLPTPPALQPPKHDGFGDEDDALGNWRSLVLKAPKQDVAKWHRYSDVLLRFQCRLHKPADSNDANRAFVLTFYVADDTLMINEMPGRNTGFTGGRFLKRQKVKKYAGEGAHCYYTHKDFEPGAVLPVCRHVFEIVGMDEYTREFKKNWKDEGDELHAVDPPSEPADAGRVKELAAQLRKAVMLRHLTLTEAFRHFDKDGDGMLPLDEVAGMLASMQLKGTRAEIIALVHHFDSNKDGKWDLNEFVEGITGNTTRSFLDGEDAEYGRPVPPTVSESVKYTDFARTRPTDILRLKVLRGFKEKLESRAINQFEMFRILTTMPSSHRVRPNDVASMASGGSDSLLGPVQLRRGIAERFSFNFTPRELELLMEFFFPTLPKHLYDAPREQTAKWRISLPQFQAKWSELNEVGQLLPSKDLKGQP
ncbi:hypothetical protein DIPPA_12627 [Diplonema papillatum]|nr:hypothetical protein DIPPA_12627 [Diplonema papillatum]